MTTEGIVLIISALTTALMTLIPLYFRERAKAQAAVEKAKSCETSARVMARSIEDAGPGPISKKIKLNVKKTSLALGIDDTLSRLVEEETSGDSI